MRHCCAEEDGRVVHIDLEPVHIALVQVVDLESFMDLAEVENESKGLQLWLQTYLGVKVVDSRGSDSELSIFELKSVLQSQLLGPTGNLPVAEH